MGGSRAVAPMVGSLPGSCMLAVGVNRKNGKMGEKWLASCMGTHSHLFLDLKRQPFRFCGLRFCFFVH